MNESQTLTRPAAAPPVPDAVQPRRPGYRPIPATQVLMVVFYWWAAAPAVYLFLTALLSDVFTTMPYQFVVLLLAVAAIVIGSVFATRIACSGSTNLAFIKGTNTMRAAAIAWHLLGIVLIVIPVIESLLPDFAFGGEDFSLPIIGTVGTVFFIAMLSSGFSEYREARAVARRPLI